MRQTNEELRDAVLRRDAQIKKMKEDMGLTPEEVSALIKDWSDLCTTVGECGGIDRLRELAEADKDGRVEVLPCRDWLDVVFGDQVLFWGIDKGCMENPIREISADDADASGGMTDIKPYI